MVIPTSRLIGLSSAAKPVLGAGLGAVLTGVGEATKSGGGAGVGAALGSFGALAKGVLESLGDSGLTAMAKLPRPRGRLGMRRPAPAGMPPALFKQGPLQSGIFGPPVTGPGSQTSKVQQWADKMESFGDMSQLQQMDLQNAMQKSQQMVQTLSNIMGMLGDAASGIIQNLK